MRSMRVLVLLSDGVSLRNFGYTNFVEKAKEHGIEICFWNATPFNLKELGYNSIELKTPKLHPLTTVLKNARKHVELNAFAKWFADSVYHQYKFPWARNSIKNRIRTVLSQLAIVKYNSTEGILMLRKLIRSLESRTAYFKNSLKQLEDFGPDLVYSTSQRSVLNIAPIEAAKRLGIPTVGFIFSWDNVPKSTLEVETDFYQVWSAHMKNELLEYHKFIGPEQVAITGTPQFETHFDESILWSKEDFYTRYNLNSKLEYLCFSGDDITTSPQDPLYLRDVAEAIRALREKGHQLGLIFRRCPVDFSDRYNEVLYDFKDVITAIDPKWDLRGKAWNTVLPTKADSVLLTNIAHHSKGVINLGSSMVFDFIAHNNPCAYINYHYDEQDNVGSGVHVYDYVHFKSMPDKKSVFWLSDPETITQKLLQLIGNCEDQISSAKIWFDRIAVSTQKNASDRMIENLSQLILK